MSSDDNLPRILKLPEILDLNAASRLHEQVLAHRGENIDVDASEVSRVGAQCVQVLLSAAQTWRSDHQSFVIAQASDAFIKTLQLLGISDEALLPKEIMK